MLLSELIGREDVPQIEINGLSNDSRNTQKGDCFFAYRGRTTDGNAFIADAIDNGAVAVCSDLANISVEVPCVHIPDLARQQSSIAGKYYGFPSESLRCVGVTGTNGKTSVAYGLASLLRDSGFGGSLGWGSPPVLAKTSLTTVDAISIQAGLASFLRQGHSHAILEVSSHALDQGRVGNVKFEVGVFTNLTRDHLDYHGSMAEYGRCKSLLFRRPEMRLGIVNVDDPYGLEILNVLEQGSTPSLTYGRSKNAMLSWTDVRFLDNTAAGYWHTPWGTREFNLPVISEFAVSNCAAVLGALTHFGIGIDDAIERMHEIPSVPGRMELLTHPSGKRAVVDFAHTPDALENVLQALRGTVKGQIISVFGCGGERDQGKRKLMAAISERYADYSIVTTDNPRDEDPEAILADIVEGFQYPKRFNVEPDRSKAIQLAYDQANLADLIVLAGKGSEQFIEMQGQRIPFSDRSTFLQTS